MSPVKRRILVIEDEKNIREFFDDFLKSEGHEPIVVNCAEEALSKSRDSKWDLVFLDLSLPRLNGWDVIRELKEIQPGIKIVITTGYPCDMLKEEGERCGVVDFLQKPFLLDDVSAVTSKHCL
ncbi:MAG: response regulator [Nitrospirota bacterium]